MARVLRRPRAAEDIAAVWNSIADDNPVPLITGSTSSTPSFGSWPRSRSWARAATNSPRDPEFPVRPASRLYLPIGDGIDVVCILHGTRGVDTAFGEDNP